MNFKLSYLIVCKQSIPFSEDVAETMMDPVQEMIEIIERDDADALKNLLFADNELVDFLLDDNDLGIHVACRSGSSKCLDLLIKCGSNINAKDSALKYTPLHIACVNGRVSCVQSLIGANANLNMEAISGLTPLNLLCSVFFRANDRNYECGKLLIHAGADITKANLYGRTPLHNACNANIEIMVQELLNSGADFTIKDKDGALPEDLTNNENIIGMIRELSGGKATKVAR